MLLALLLSLQPAKVVDGWIVQIRCSQKAAACPIGVLSTPILATEAQAQAEADSISTDGCWIVPIEGTCQSVRPADSVEKLAPGGIFGLSLVPLR